MRRIDDRETPKSAKGVCAMGLSARFGRHASFIGLAYRGDDEQKVTSKRQVHPNTGDSHRCIHSARPLNRLVCPAAHAGESAARSRGSWSSEIMTAAQYAPLQFILATCFFRGARRRGARAVKGQNIPNIDFAANSHLKSAIWLLE